MARRKRIVHRGGKQERRGVIGPTRTNPCEQWFHQHISNQKSVISAASSAIPCQRVRFEYSNKQAANPNNRVSLIQDAPSITTSQNPEEKWSCIQPSKFQSSAAFHPVISFLRRIIRAFRRVLRINGRTLLKTNTFCTNQLVKRMRPPSEASPAYLSIPNRTRTLSSAVLPASTHVKARRILPRPSAPDPRCGRRSAY